MLIKAIIQLINKFTLKILNLLMVQLQIKMMLTYQI